MDKQTVTITLDAYAPRTWVQAVERALTQAGMADAVQSLLTPAPPRDLVEIYTRLPANVGLVLEGAK